MLTGHPAVPVSAQEPGSSNVSPVSSNDAALRRGHSPDPRLQRLCIFPQLAFAIGGGWSAFSLWLLRRQRADGKEHLVPSMYGTYIITLITSKAIGPSGSSACQAKAPGGRGLHPQEPLPLPLEPIK